MEISSAEEIVHRHLPSPLKWYSCVRQRLFPMYGLSGAITGLQIAIVIHHLAKGFAGEFGGPGLHDGPDGKWFRIDFLVTDTPDEAGKKFTEAMDALTKE